MKKTFHTNLFILVFLFSQLIFASSFYQRNNSSSVSSSASVSSKGDYVVLVHGILSSHKELKKIKKDLLGRGYNAISINYPSSDYPLEELTEIVYKKIQKKINKNKNKNKKIHFVAHSMGGLILRMLLYKYKIPNLGRVIHIATPNKGSELADALKDQWGYKKIYGPAGQQLITDQSKIKHLLGKVFYELGIIAGTQSLDLYSSHKIIPGIDDGHVSVESTKVKGMKDHTLVHSSHLFISKNKKTREQVINFLEEGFFSRKVSTFDEGLAPPN